MKKVGFSLLSFLTGVYFTIGGYSINLHLLLLIIKLGRREFSINSEEEVLPPYHIDFTAGFYASLVAFLVIGYILIGLPTF